MQDIKKKKGSWTDQDLLKENILLFVCVKNTLNMTLLFKCYCTARSEWPLLEDLSKN